jgi:hypothetical protein
MKCAKTLSIFGACASLLFSSACGGGSKTPTNTIVTSGPNVAPISVNSGPQNDYTNGAFVSVTICVPGTTNCQTISDVLVDTGSYGLRIVSSPVLGLTLPQEMASDSSPMVECVQFLDSYTWGPIQIADVEVASEKASSVPIQVLSDTDYTAPSSCTDAAAGSSADTVESLGANGILGVGQLPQDCGTNTTCAASANQYYSCASTTSCTPVDVTAAQQVANPVSLFTTDNNGVIIELPQVSGGETSISGSLVFGIGTESNNGLAGATVYTSDPTTLNFTTSFNNTTYTDAGFLDSGSNGYFFPDNSIDACPTSSGAGGFYCPSGTDNLSATNQGTNNASGSVNFSVANAVNLFSENPSDAVFSDLGGPAANYFDWGLPFFYGQNVFTAISGKSAPGGTTPYWAY